MWPFKLIALLFAVLLLTQCHMPSTQKREGTSDNISTFYIEKITGKFVSESFRSEISIPKERTFNFNLCLKDLKKSKPVINHPFYIEEINQEVKSDANGCLNWQESFAFNYLSSPTFIKVERSIKSLGIHMGSEKSAFAINLWDIETYKDVVDLKKDSVTPLIEGEAVPLKLSGKNSESSYDLWVEDGRMFVTDEKLGENFQLRYDFSLQPFIKFKKTSGEQFNYALKYGSFKGKVEVVQRYFNGNSQENELNVIAEAYFDNSLMNKGILSLSKTLTFSAPPSRGNLFIRLSMSPQNPVTNLSSYQGLFPIGEFRNIRSNQFLKVSNNAELINEFKKLLPTNSEPQAAAKTTPEVTEDKGINADSVISIAPLSFDPLNGSQVNYHQKIVRYNVTACFSNNLVSSPVVFQKFKVYGFSQNENKPGELKEPKKSNHLGCIYWTDSVEFDMYDCHQFYRGYVIIENPNLNMKVKRYYFINPWEPYSFGTDENRIDNVNVLNTSCAKKYPKKSEIVLDSVSLENQGQNNKNRINNKLEMEITRHLGITLYPKVSVPSDIRHDYNAYNENLANGIYLLRIAIFKNFQTHSTKELIAYKDIPVLNKNNIIYGKFNYSLKNIRLLETRNTVLLQLLPVKQEDYVVITDEMVQLKDPNKNTDETIDNNSKLISPIYRQEVALEGEAKHVNLRTFNGSEIVKHLGVEYKDENKNFNLSHFLNEFKLKTQEESKLQLSSQETLNHLSQLNNLKSYTIDSLNSYDFTKSVQKVLETRKFEFDKSAGVSLCRFWFEKMWQGKFNWGEAFLKRACQSAANSNLKSFFDFDHIYIVQNISNSEYLGPGFEKNIITSTSFSLSTALANSSSTQLALAGKIGLGVKGHFLSGGSEFSLQAAKSQQTTKAEANMITLTESSNLQVSESQFKITTNNYNYCLSIKPKPHLFYDSGKNFALKIWDGEIDFNYFFKNHLSSEEKLKAANAGIIICNPIAQSTPWSLIEQYYWVEQKLNTNEIQDAKDDRTKIFNVLIRGNQDYVRFKLLLSNKWENPDGSNPNHSLSQRTFGNLLYLQSFKNTLPNVYLYKEP